MLSSLSQPPSGEELERFLVSMVPKIKPRGSVPSYSWMKGGLIVTINGLIFKYEFFKLNSHASPRITSLMNTLYTDGKLTKEPIREKQWVGVVLVRAMVVAFMSDALEQGIRNWDMVISRVSNVLWMWLCSAEEVIS